MNQELIGYIKDARGHGLSDQEIKQNLLDAGWEAQMVEDSFAHLRARENQPAANADEDLKPAQKSTVGFVPEGAQPLSKPIQTSGVPGLKGASPAQTQAEASPRPTLNSPAPLYRQKKFWLSLIILLIVAGGAAASYTFWYSGPERVWKKFTEITQDKLISSEFKFVYTDKSEAAADDLLDFPLSNLSLELTGKAYADTQDADNPQSSSEISYAFKSGNTSFQTGFEYKLIGKKLYLNVGNNPFLEGAFAQLGQGKKIEWVVLDVEELKNKAEEQSAEDAAKFRQIFNPEFVDEIKKIWGGAIFVKLDKYLSKETTNGRSTLHFSNSLDKSAIKQTFNAILDKIIAGLNETGLNIGTKEADTAKTAIAAIVDKLEIKTFETWIGAKDFKLYQSKIVIAAPSVISAVNALAKGPRESSRDAKRLADVRQMASALELYYNDKGRYPSSSGGKPLDLTPVYIGMIPIAPQPADGNCTDYYNTYWYEAKNNNASYEMTFCLGKNTGGYSEGILMLSPAGIQNAEGCPSAPDKCYKSGQPESAGTAIDEQAKTQEEEIKTVIDKISFDAEISLEANYRDYGVKKEVKAPEGAFDLLELMGRPPQMVPSVYDPTF